MICHCRRALRKRPIGDRITRRGVNSGRRRGRHHWGSSAPWPSAAVFTQRRVLDIILAATVCAREYDPIRSSKMRESGLPPRPAHALLRLINS